MRLAEAQRARVFHAPMSGRCGFPNDHALFAGHLPPRREQIVQTLAGHDYVLLIGAPVFAFHVDGAGPFLPAGTGLGQLIDDPEIAAWAPVGTAVLCSIRLAAPGSPARLPIPFAASSLTPSRFNRKRNFDEPDP